MTGTFAGQHVMEGFLNWKVSPVIRVTITRSIALGPAIAVGIYMSTNSAAGDVLNEVGSILFIFYSLFLLFFFLILLFSFCLLKLGEKKKRKSLR